MCWYDSDPFRSDNEGYYDSCGNWHGARGARPEHRSRWHESSFAFHGRCGTLILPGEPGFNINEILRSGIDCDKNSSR